jgi:hypothetical protein
MRWRYAAALLAAVIAIAAVLIGMAYSVPDKLRNIALKIGAKAAATVLPENAATKSQP